ncbi:MAG TPA: hypothetical protein VMR88_00540, partial [Candidatus Polarisedimenticolaceae bacterium]|nr:hypothetical protein [Candidatus Polarisedimenticolaceae bacterium]
LAGCTWIENDLDEPEKRIILDHDQGLNRNSHCLVPYVYPNFLANLVMIRPCPKENVDLAFSAALR